MDQILLDNVDRYQKLVAQFKPSAPPTTEAKGQMVSNPDFTIAARVRPMLEDELSAGLVPGVFLRKGGTGTNGGVIDVHELRRKSFNYRVDRAYGEDATTEAIYSELVSDLVPWAWGGGVSTLFAYGQTGSGKTFTVNGLEILVADALLGSTCQLQGHRQLHLSIVELAGNSAYDLLNARKPISILEDSFGATHLAGAAEHPVPSAAAFHEFIEGAAKFRTTATTEKNDFSSRSHSICRLRIVNPALPGSEDGLLYLVDLAGSEVARDIFSHSQDRMRETREINVSLSTLKDCMRGRAALDLSETPSGPGRKAKAKPYIPFRQSALTKVLKHVFDPAAERVCKTVVMACVNPCFMDVGASKNTLRYSEMLRVDVPAGKPLAYTPNVPRTWSNEQLRNWIAENSGKPEIDAAALAPKETGAQLVRLPLPEFLSRCMTTTGVDEDQARVFHSKLWRLHIDSQRTANTTPTPQRDADETAGTLGKVGLSSVDRRPEMLKIPFKERLRPGMVVSWDPPEGATRLPGRNLALILSPSASETDGQYDSTKFVCAMVVPGLMTGAFDLYLWQQVVVDVERMQAEILLEYDVTSRYYYETV